MGRRRDKLGLRPPLDLGPLFFRLQDRPIMGQFLSGLAQLHFQPGSFRKGGRTSARSNQTSGTGVLPVPPMYQNFSQQTGLRKALPGLSAEGASNQTVG